MMPYCEYHKCKSVAESKCGLLRKWDSYSNQNNRHHQDIWLCKKHLKKINKLLEVAEVSNDTE